MQQETTKRILMLAWEYPPNLVGGLARVVYFLSRELAQHGHEVHVITADCKDAPEHEIDNGVHVHRVKTQQDPTPDFMSWIAQLNFGILQYAIPLARKVSFDIIHAHDWLVAHAAWVMKTTHDIPLISTMHATEQGRSKGLHNDRQRYINTIEWRLTYECRRIIVNSRQMVDDLRNQLGVPSDKVFVIPNGIDINRFRSNDPITDVRQRLGIDSGPMVLMVGRMVQEKGVQVLLEAAPSVLQRFPRAQFMIAGDGYHLNTLKAQAASSPACGRIRFFGLANDEQLRDLYRAAYVAVVPSLYEPFGIVVLEAMATGTPVVTSDVGGINDIVRHLENGVKTQAGNPASLGDGINTVIAQVDLASRIRAQALEDVERSYSWATIAEDTLNAYDRAIG